MGAPFLSKPTVFVEYCRIFAGRFLTMANQIEQFNDDRTRMNALILGKQNKVINRLFNLDTNTYAAGALSSKTKEMLGLVASMVLRCDDCVKYHLGKCHELAVNTEEMYEIFAVANIVGGTIVIPHTRRAAEYWEQLSDEGKNKAAKG
jgi:AhpD family alkylhydroperoxidase